MRVLIYKDEVLDALQTCLDTEVIPYGKGKNYIRYEQAVYEINKLQDKSELFGNFEQLDGEYDPRPDIYYLAEKIGIHRLYALVIQLRGEPELCEDSIIEAVKSAPYVQPKQVIPHRNYKNLLAYWCECGCYLGIKGETNYCPDCGRKVNWNGRTD